MHLNANKKLQHAQAEGNSMNEVNERIIAELEDNTQDMSLKVE